MGHGKSRVSTGGESSAAAAGLPAHRPAGERDAAQRRCTGWGGRRARASTVVAGPVARVVAARLGHHQLTPKPLRGLPPKTTTSPSRRVVWVGATPPPTAAAAMQRTHRGSSPPPPHSRVRPNAHE